MKSLPVLPAMRCDDGCGRCCGPVPVTARELGRIRAYLRETGIRPNPNAPALQCPLYDGQRCTIYPVRPLLCRVFGHTKFLECPRGYNTNIADSAIRNAVRHNGKAVGLLGALLQEREL